MRQEAVPEAQTFTSLFETEAVYQEVEEVDENLLVSVRDVRSVVVGVDLYSGASTWAGPSSVLVGCLSL